MENDFRRIMECTCMRMRRSTRRVTQLYDRALEPAALTVNQFGLLAYLHGASLQRSNDLATGTIAEGLGVAPTTLIRLLNPLAVKGLVREAIDPGGGRVRIVRITDKWRLGLLKAVPLWRGAQAQVDTALGAEATASLNEL